MEIAYSLKELPKIAQYLINESNSKVLCFYGDMGVGKTTLIKELVTLLGCMASTSSPTFGIVNEYPNENGDTVAYHFDFYRLNDEIEALDFGVEDYLYSNKWVLIEWPNKIKGLLPQNTTNIFLEIVSESKRKLLIE